MTNKKEDEKNPDYTKINKEVKQSFYDYDKMFINLMTSLSKCETKGELEYFRCTFVNGFKDAPDELVEYLNNSIKNKMISLNRREDIDLGKLRSISNHNL